MHRSARMQAIFKELASASVGGENQKIGMLQKPLKEKSEVGRIDDKMKGFIVTNSL